MPHEALDRHAVSHSVVREERHHLFGRAVDKAVLCAVIARCAYLPIDAGLPPEVLRDRDILKLSHFLSLVRERFERYIGIKARSQHPFAGQAAFSERYIYFCSGELDGPFVIGLPLADVLVEFCCLDPHLVCPDAFAL